MQLCNPDEIYNLAAQSHVRISFDMPIYTTHSIATGTLNLLESMRLMCPKAKFYQASSSEMFGNNVDKDGFQRETTPMDPVSPYGCAKLYAYNICRNYRKAYGMFISNGILFNHESPRRGTNFVTNKVVKEAVKIKLGLTTELKLGNLNASRDWGHAKDYVKAMWLMLQQNKPQDFVIATGRQYTVKQFINLSAKKLEMPLIWKGAKLKEKAYFEGKPIIEIDPKYFRPAEVESLLGNSLKAQKKLKWKPSYSINTLIDDMIDKIKNQ